MSEGRNAQGGKAANTLDTGFLDVEAAELLRALASMRGVAGILLGGSRASGRAQEGSDWDFYVYAEAEIPLEERKRALPQLFSRLELDNRFWETEDDGILLSGTPVDIVYRNPAWTREALEAKLERHQADTGYTTCVWANVREALVLYDPEGAMAALKALADRPYPEALARNIVSKNLPLLGSGLPAYRGQIEKALGRKDFVSVNHRMAAYLASWFDILFAVNRVPHPGEKRLVELAPSLCQRKPPRWEEDLSAALSLAASGSSGLLDALDRLSAGIEALAE